MPIFPNRFLPFPPVYSYTINGINGVNSKDVSSKKEFASLKEKILWKLKPSDVSITTFELVPFVTYCPSMFDSIHQGICKTCGVYWASKTAMLRHAVCYKNIPNGQTVEDEI